MLQRIRTLLYTGTVQTHVLQIPCHLTGPQRAREDLRRVHHEEGLRDRARRRGTYYFICAVDTVRTLLWILRGAAGE